MSGNLTGLAALMRGSIGGAGSLATGRIASAQAHSQANRTLESLTQILDLPKDVVDRRRKASDTILQLQDAQRSMVSDRKAAAKQRLDMAKARLQMLRMFAGDPKAMAQQAKQIAREIQQAANAYGAALQAEGAAAVTGAVGAAPAQAGDGGAEAGPGVHVDPAQTAAAAVDAPNDRNGVGDKAVEPTDRSGNPAKGEREKAAEAYQAAAADLSSRHSKSQGEREAIEAFKQAAREAKRLIEEAARRMKAEEGGEGEVRQLDASARAMTRAVDDLDKAVAGAGQAGLGAAGVLPVGAAVASAVSFTGAIDLLA